LPVPRRGLHRDRRRRRRSHPPTPCANARQHPRSPPPRPARSIGPRSPLSSTLQAHRVEPYRYLPAPVSHRPAAGAGRMKPLPQWSSRHSVSRLLPADDKTWRKELRALHVTNANSCPRKPEHLSCRFDLFARGILHVVDRAPISAHFSIGCNDASAGAHLASHGSRRTLLSPSQNDVDPAARRPLTLKKVQ
jgi:hypothetical protein